MDAMYAPRFFREPDHERMCELIECTGFGLLITSDSGGRIMNTFAPMLLERDTAAGLRLIGHMARANPQWRATPQGSEAVAVFMGAHGYVTPTWYAREPDVPTWNYRSVEVRGSFELIEEDQQIRRLLERSVDHFESLSGHTWKLSDIDEPVVAGFQKAVAAFAIGIASLSGATKYSQDKQIEDRERVIEGLKGSGRVDLATAMEATILAEYMKRS